VCGLRSCRGLSMTIVWQRRYAFNPRSIECSHVPVLIEARHFYRGFLAVC
jgi:hypothetical protein